MGDPVKDDTRPATSPDADNVNVGSIDPSMSDPEITEAIVKAYSGISEDMITEFSINPDVQPKDLAGFKVFMADNLFIETPDDTYLARFERLRNKVIDDMAPRLFPATQAEATPYVHQSVKPDQQPATNAATGADPVILFNGNFVYEATDLELMAPGIQFSFRRCYSQLSLYNGPLGHNWDHCYNLWIRQSEDPNIVHCSDGKLGEALYRRHSAHDYFIPPPGSTGTILETGGSYQLQRPDGSKAVYQQHPTLGPLVHVVEKIEDRFGNYLKFSYTDGRLASVEINHPGRTAVFSYDSQNRITTLSDFTGRTWRYTYDDFDDLTAVTTPGTPAYPRGLSTRYEYSSAQYYSSASQHNLTAVIDANGLIYLENEYGTVPGLVSFNRVVRQRQSGGDVLFDYADVTEAFDFEYGNHERPTHQTIVTEADGREARYLFNRSGMMLFREEYARLDGLPKLITTHYRYNRDGNLTGTISPLGVIQQFLYGRDYYEKVVVPGEDYLPEEDDHLTRQKRESFNVLLAQVRRSGYHTPGSLDLSGGIWSCNIFGDIYLTAPEDMIQKFTYEPEFLQVSTVSDPRFTQHADPDRPEPGSYQQHLTRYEYSPGGGFTHYQLAAVELPRPTLPDGTAGERIRTEFSGYAAKGNPSKIIGPNGLITVNEYFTAAEGLLEGFVKATVVDEGSLAARAEVERDVLGRITRSFSAKHFIDPNGRHFTSATYNALGQITEIVGPGLSGVATRYSYTRTGQVKLASTDLKDAAGNPEGVFENFNTYDESFNLVAQLSGDLNNDVAKKRKFIYDRAGRPMISILPGDHKVKVRYNERGFPSQTITDYGGVHSTNKKYYDADGRVIRTVDPLGNSTRYEYDSFGRPVVTSDAAGNRQVRHHDKSGNITTELFFEKNVAGNFLLLSRKESRYDELGRKIGIGLNRFDTAPEIPPGQLLTAFIDNGPGELLQSSYYFNSIGNLVKIVDQSGKNYVSEFDIAGRLLSKTDPLDNKVSFIYDIENNIIRSDRSELTRDGGGNIVSSRHFAEQFSYDGQNRLIEKTDQLGSKTTYAYDSRNNLGRSTDTFGNECFYSYDIFSRMLQKKAALHHYTPGETALPVITSYHYNPADQVDLQTDALGRPTRFEYDSAGRQTASVLSDGSRDQSSFDRAGNITQYIDRNGLKKEMIYNELQQIIKIKIDISEVEGGNGAGGNLEYTRSYDGLGRVSLAATEQVTTGLKYNSLGWNTEEITSLAPIEGIVFPDYRLARTFNNNGAQTGLVYPSGRSVAYDRDVLERLVAIRQVESGNSYPGDSSASGSYTIANFEYEGLQRKKIIRGNNTSTIFQYDFGARLAGISHSRNNVPFLELQFLYDSAGNMRQQAAISADYTHTQVYGYDSLSRLSTVREKAEADFIDLSLIKPPALPVPATIPSYQQQIDVLGATAMTIEKRRYHYDLAGNRLNVVSTAIIEQYQPNPLDQYEKINLTDYTYNKNGNLSAGDNLRYIYNHQDQPVSVENASTGIAERQIYDAFGRRCAEISEGNVKTMIHDGYNPLEVYKDAVLFSSTVCDQGPDNLLISSWGSGEHYFYPDLTKSVRYIYNLSGKENFYRYDEFGNLEDSFAPADENHFRFQGKRIMPATGHYDFVFRTYSPAAGRFTQRDPKGTVDGTNLYSFAKNNPLTHTDPLGTESRPETAGNGAITAFRAANTPVDVTGNPLKGPYNLWSHDVPGGGLDKAKAASGWIMGQTPDHQIAEAAQLAHPNNATNNIPPKDWDDIWGKSSRSIARRAVISGKPVRSFGLDTHPNPTGTMQYQHEIPTVARWGVFTGFTMKLGGFLNLWNASQIDNPWVKGFGIFGGAAEIVGGTSYLAGAATMNTAAMSFGSGITRFIGGPTTILLSGYAFYHDIKNGNYLDAVGSGSGVLTGVALTVGWTTGAVVFGSFGAGWSFGRWIDKKTGWSTSLANRADRNREIYQDMGLGDTSSKVLGAAANHPYIK